MPQPTPPHILPFHHLMRMLKMNGFILGVDSYVRVVEYWQQMVGETELIREEAKAQLGALLCRSEEQQIRFGQLFDTFLPPNLQPLEDWKDTPNNVFVPKNNPLEIDRPILKPIQILSEFLPLEVKTSTSNSESLGPVLPLLNFPEESLRVWNLAGMSQALTPLQEKVWVDSFEWDVPATIRAIIKAGGYPKFVFKKRKQAPRYLALIEQQSPRDHLAGYAAELVKEINHRDLEADYYFFDKNPAHCWKVQRDLHTHKSIELLKSEWSGARLLLFGHASRFVNPANGMPSNLALDLPDDFSQIAFLASNPSAEWGTPEHSLSSLMPVLPMSVEGLSKLMGGWNGAVPPSFADWQMKLPEPVPPDFSDGLWHRKPQEIFMELYRYLGKDAFRWLCACAVYPEIYFELTCILHDEAIPLSADLSQWERNEKWNKALRLLSRLEWFRRGFLPDSLTDDLKKNLSPADLALVEGEIRRILAISKNSVGRNTYAAELRKEMYDWLADQNFRVLWIDDHPENNERFISSWSKSLGIVFRQVTSTYEAAAILEEERFDLIISDIGREGEERTGYATMEMVGTRVPVIFYTNKRGLNLRNALLEAGAMDVVASVGDLRVLLTDELRKKFPLPETPPPPDEQILVNQERLKKLGFYQGEMNGQNSAEWREAIKAFQSSKNLATDGIIGRQTQSVIILALDELDAIEGNTGYEEQQQTSSAQPYDYIRDMIRDGEVRKVLQEMRNTWPQNNELVMLMGRFREVEKSLFQGVISNAEHAEQINQIRANCLELLHQLENENYTQAANAPNILQTSSTNNQTDYIRDMIANAEEEKALEAMAEFWPENKEMILLRERLRKVTNDYRNNIISNEDFSFERNRIRSNVLELLNDLVAGRTSGTEEQESARTKLTKKDILDLLANDEIDTVYHALNVASDQGNEIVLLSSRWHNLQRDINSGIISDENARVIKAQIVNGLLSIVQELPDDIVVEMPTDTTSSTTGTGDGRIKIFLSYDQKDKEYANRVRAFFRKRDIPVVIDSEAMKAGEDIQSFMNKAIRQSDVIISLVSTNSLLSAWVGMQTTNSLVGEKISDKMFIPCAVDPRYFERSFVDYALDEIDKELVEINKSIQQRLDKKRGIEDLQEERARYKELSSNLPNIVANLKERLTVDISGDNFESGMQRVLETIMPTAS
jgi:CheY-like chemotaxis protein